MRVFHVSRRKRLRGAVMIAAAIAAGGYLVLRRPDLNMTDPFDVGLIAVTWALLFWIAAVGIERLFEPMPTLVACPEGLVLFPATDPGSIVAWRDIRKVEIFSFGRSRFASRFLTIVVDDPRVISRHLPLHLKIAYRIDRWAAGDGRYFRPRSDFEVPLAQVADELEAWRVTWSDADAAPPD